jgi:hypothetical protein
MTNANAKAVINGIKTLTSAETKVVIAALNARIKQLRDETAQTFEVGQKVSFQSRKAGGTIHGTIEKINKATIVVKTLGGTWKVTPTLLKAA